jgi:hypothetical protein
MLNSSRYSRDTAYTFAVRHDLPDIYDDRPLGPRAKRSTWPWMLLALAVAAAGASYWYAHYEPAKPAAKALLPVHVVRDRPGGNVDEATAVQLLRRHFAARMPEQCIATISNGRRGSVYRFIVINSCDHTRLGRWQVDVRTKAITPSR